MNEVDVNDRLRELCKQISEEQDPQRVQELTRTLKDTVRAAHDEARVRMSYVARHFRGRLEAVSTRPGAERVGHPAGIRAVLQFLVFGAEMRMGGESEG